VLIYLNGKSCFVLFFANNDFIQRDKTLKTLMRILAFIQLQVIATSHSKRLDKPEPAARLADG
jgi:hypothetical protein